MKEYESPSAELITFSDEKILTKSGCDCHYDIESQSLQSQFPEVECEAESGGAHENPFGVKAPLWTFG